MNTQNRFNSRMSTPWGRIQDYHIIADGVVSVSTAGHGGIWLSDRISPNCQRIMSRSQGRVDGQKKTRTARWCFNTWDCFR